MVKIISIDPSGTGTTGICLTWGFVKLFFQFKSKKWQEHYQYIFDLIQREKPNLVLIETAYYETKSGNKDLMDLEKLVGALECLKFHVKPQIIMRQNKLTKDYNEKLKKGKKTIPNLFYYKGKWIYCEETTENEREARKNNHRVNQGRIKKESSETVPKIQELSEHQADALIIWHLYSKSNPYLGESSWISRNSRYC